MQPDIFTNVWMLNIWNNYSIFMLCIFSAIVFILKLIAIFNPNIPSDAIIDLMRRTFKVNGKDVETILDNE
jgi:hypothetical protein